MLQPTLPAQSSSEWPFVSVIMPIRNEARSIRHTLESVLAQDYPPGRLEVLIVDGMSDDGTREIVQGLIESQHVDGLPSSIALIDNPGRIVPTAFNRGLRQSRGQIIVRVDGHCELASDYVRRCVEVLQATGADNVGGLQRAIGDTPTGQTIALATSSPFGVGGARFHYAQRPGPADTVYLGAYRREVFDRIGGFDEDLVRNQDDEFNFRLTQAGGMIWLDPSICSVYHSRSTLARLWRQYFEYGFYKVRVMQKRGAVASWRHLVPGLFVLGLLASLFLALATRRARLALVVAGPYAAATTAASVWTARQAPRLLPRLPAAFITMHLAYGLGFLAGLWRWRGRR